MLLFVMGILASGKALVKSRENKEYIGFAVFIFMVCIIQLFEYLLWKNQECNKTNTEVSYAIIITLGLQPILYTIAMIGILKEYKILILLLCLLLLILMIVSVTYILPGQQVCSLKDDKSCRLRWDSVQKLWDYSNAYVVVSFIIYLSIYYFVGKNVMISKLLNSLLILALFVSIVYSLAVNTVNAASIFGGFWCFLAVILCVIV